MTGGGKSRQHHKVRIQCVSFKRVQIHTHRKLLVGDVLHSSNFLNAPENIQLAPPPPKLTQSRSTPPLYVPSEPSRPPPKTSYALSEAIKTLGHTVRRHELHPAIRGRVTAMLAFLRYYTTLTLEKNWTESSELAAIGAGGGPSLARKLRSWVMTYLGDPQFLPTIRCTNARRALIDDEDINQELKLHIMEAGK